MMGGSKEYASPRSKASTSMTTSMAKPPTTSKPVRSSNRNHHSSNGSSNVIITSILRGRETERLVVHPNSAERWQIDVDVTIKSDVENDDKYDYRRDNNYVHHRFEEPEEEEEQSLAFSVISDPISHLQNLTQGIDVSTSSSSLAIQPPSSGSCIVSKHSTSTTSSSSSSRRSDRRKSFRDRNQSCPSLLSTSKRHGGQTQEEEEEEKEEAEMLLFSNHLTHSPLLCMPRPKPATISNVCDLVRRECSDETLEFIRVLEGAIGSKDAKNLSITTTTTTTTTTALPLSSLTSSLSKTESRRSRDVIPKEFRSESMPQPRRLSQPPPKQASPQAPSQRPPPRLPIVRASSHKLNSTSSPKLMLLLSPSNSSSKIALPEQHKPALMLGPIKRTRTPPPPPLTPLRLHKASPEPSTRKLTPSHSRKLDTESLQRSLSFKIAQVAASLHQNGHQPPTTPSTTPSSPKPILIPEQPKQQAMSAARFQRSARLPQTPPPAMKRSISMPLRMPLHQPRPSPQPSTTAAAVADANIQSSKPPPTPRRKSLMSRRSLLRNAMLGPTIDSHTSVAPRANPYFARSFVEI